MQRAGRQGPASLVMPQEFRKQSAPGAPAKDAAALGPWAAANGHVDDNSSRAKHLVGSDVEHLHKHATGAASVISRNLPSEITNSYLSDARSDVQRARQELHEQQDALSSMSHFEKQARLKQLQSLGKENQLVVEHNGGVTATFADKSKPPTRETSGHKTALDNAIEDGADSSGDRNENRASESEHEPSNIADCDTEQWLKRIVAQFGHGS